MVEKSHFYEPATKPFQAAGSVLLIAAAMAVLLAAASPVRAGGLTPEEIRAEAARYQALGGVYQAEGFKNFPTGDLPFQRYRKIKAGRLVGRTVMVNPGGIRIFKTLYCSGMNFIYNQISVRLKNEDQLVFGWQDCLIGCEIGGLCDMSGLVYLDVTGDGKPDVRLPGMEEYSRVFHPGQASWVELKADIIPAWVKKELGPGNANLSDLGPNANVGFWEDNPLNVNSIDPSDSGVGFRMGR